MIQGLEAITAASLSMALDAATLRHQLITANIAKMNVEGYVPQRLNFTAYIEDARRQLSDDGVLSAASLLQLAQSPMPVESVLTSAGTPAQVQLDMEVAGMAENDLQYQALLKGLDKFYAALSLAVGDGKR